MAKSRMIDLNIVDSDKFLEMPPTAQNLYFHLCVRTDDYGFVNSPKKIQRTTCASDDDLKLLIAEEYIIPFESGVIVVTDWNIHNSGFRKDRRKSPTFKEEFSQLVLLENGIYKLCQSNDGQMTVNLCQNVSVKESKIKESKIKESNNIYTSSSDDDCVRKNAIKDIITYLNQKASTNFRATTIKTKKLINARMNENYTVDDFKKVIDIKCKDWLNNPDMAKFIRPETLFGAKFESYLNEAISIETRRNQEQQAEDYIDF